MNVAHLFAGAGGGILASEILGHRSILAIEENEYRCERLKDRKCEGWFPRLHIECRDIRRYDFQPWHGVVDCVAAGFPCQDISSAGSGDGIDGEKSGLIWQAFRAVDSIEPGLVFLENSPRIKSRGRREIIGALEDRGYVVRDGTLEAFDIGAPHRRNRWWLLAANIDGLRKLEQERIDREKRRRTGHRLEDVADTLCSSLKDGEFGKRYSETWREDELLANQIENPTHVGGHRCKKEQPQGKMFKATHGNCWPPHTLLHQLQIAIQCGGLSKAEAETIQAVAGYTGAYGWSPPDTGICRMVHGMADWVDKGNKGKSIAAAGDGQVPLQAALAWLLLSK